MTMANHLIIPLILCGGAGSRLWPLSRTAKPKQFLKFESEFSLLQETLMRCSSDEFSSPPIIVSSELQRFLIAEDLREIAKTADTILEPSPRDSCAAIVAGCLQALQRSPDAMVLVMAADHKISDAKAFRNAVVAASEDAANGYLTTFGVLPSHPATGFGYIKPGAELREGGSAKLDKFVEKPDVAKAQRYIDEGYLWNSGNFLFSAQVFLSELEKYAPQILNAVRSSFLKARVERDFIWLEPESFAAAEKTSIDYAVMEKTDRAAVFKVDYGWSDIGSWDAVHAISDRDSNANVIQGNSFVLDGSNNLVRSHGTFTALVGVDDIIVAVSDDAILITKRGQSEKVKELVAQLKTRKIKEAD